MGEALKNKKKKLTMHLNLNLVVLHESILSLSAEYVFMVCTTDKGNIFFSINGIG